MQQFIEKSRYYLAVEYITKISHCIEALPADALWKRPNDTSNSIGNLLLHLAGNIRQWIVGGVGNKEVTRVRASEFAAIDGATKEALLEDLQRAVGEVDAVLAALSADDLLDSRIIQGRNTTVFAAIYHVVEHFAMHTGQIVMMTKIYSAGTVEFYRDADGLAKPKWGGAEGMV